MTDNARAKVAIVRVTAEPRVDFDALHRDDQACAEDIVGEHEFRIAVSSSVEAMRREIRGRSWASADELQDLDEQGVCELWLVEKAKDEYHETPIKVLDDFLIEVEVVSMPLCLAQAK